MSFAALMAGIIVAVHLIVRPARFALARAVAVTAGVSLVEVLISTTVLVTAMLSLPQLFVIAARATAEAGDVTAATLLAAQKIEELRSRPFQPASAADGVESLDASGDDVDAYGAAPVFVRTWWIAPVPSAPDTAIAIGVAVSRYRPADGAYGGATGPESARFVSIRAKTRRDD